MVLAYDERNRLRTTTVNGVLTRTAHYNGKGERVLRKHNPTSPTGDIQFVYDEAGHLLGEYTTAGVRLAEYVWMEDTLVAVFKSHDGTTYQLVETDHLGTPRAIVNPATNIVVWRWDLTTGAFGDGAVQNDPDGNGINYAFALRFPGQYAEGIAMMHYNYFRDYDSTTGRYLQSDPIGLSGGVNTYGYVGGNPVGASDPFGLHKYVIQPPTERMDHPGTTYVPVYYGQTPGQLRRGRSVMGQATVQRKLSAHCVCSTDGKYRLRELAARTRPVVRLNPNSADVPWARRAEGDHVTDILPALQRLDSAIAALEQGTRQNPYETEAECESANEAALDQLIVGAIAAAARASSARHDGRNKAHDYSNPATRRP